MSDNPDDLTVELRAVTLELEQDVEFGPAHVDFADRRLEGTIGRDPIGRRFRDILEESGHAYHATKLDDEYALWLIPHRLALSSRSNWAAITAAGMDVEYDAGGKTCSIVQLWPAAEYRLDASLAMHVEMPMPPLGVKPQVRLRIGGFEIGIGDDAEVKFTAGVTRPVVTAIGVGSRACSWEFLSSDPPLAGRDIETWSLVILPSGMKRPLKYKIRAWARHRIAFVPTRVQSDWVEVSCKLVG